MQRFRLPTLKATSDELLHLDLIRFVASAGIVYHHSHEFFFNQNIRAQAIEKSYGLALFVDLFFVISGFIIAYVYSDYIKNPVRFLKFMQRRVGRLVPLHWLTLILYIVLFWMLLKLGIAPKNVPSFRLECMADTAFLLHAAVPCGGYYFNDPTWSISAEMAMYVAFPFFAMLAIRWRAAPLAIGGLILGWIGVRELAVGSLLSYDWTSLHPLLRALPSFLLGVGFYHYRTALSRIPAAPVLLASSLLGLIGSMVSGAPMCLTLALVYLTAIAGIAADMQGNAVKFVRKVAPLGQMTYSIYMWHSLFIAVIINFIGDKILHLSMIPMVFLTLFCYCLLLSFSYVSFIFIETPARRWVDRLPFRVFMSRPAQGVAMANPVLDAESGGLSNVPVKE